MSKGHGSQFKVALTRQIWQNLNIKMNNKSNDNLCIINISEFILQMKK